MSSLSLRLQRLTRRYSRTSRGRGAVIRHAAKAFEMVSFGSLHHSDDIDPVRGFTASTTHIDQHYCVGTYDGHPIRLIDRFDTVRTAKAKEHAQNWLIIEVSLESTHVPHICMVPTGNTSKEYHRLFTAASHLQPLNASFLRTHSIEVHGRFQILARTSRMQAVEALLTSPLVVGIGTRFWPHGIEIHGDKLYVYITDHRLDKAMVSSTIASALWLADMINQSSEQEG